MPAIECPPQSEQASAPTRQVPLTCNKRTHFGGKRVKAPAEQCPAVCTKAERALIAELFSNIGMAPAKAGINKILGAYNARVIEQLEQISDTGQKPPFSECLHLKDHRQIAEFIKTLHKQQAQSQADSFTDASRFQRHFNLNEIHHANTHPLLALQPIDVPAPSSIGQRPPTLSPAPLAPLATGRQVDQPELAVEPPNHALTAHAASQRKQELRAKAAKRKRLTTEAPGAQPLAGSSSSAPAAHQPITKRGGAGVPKKCPYCKLPLAKIHKRNTLCQFVQRSGDGKAIPDASRPSTKHRGIPEHFFLLNEEGQKLWDHVAKQQQAEQQQDHQQEDQQEPTNEEQR